MTQYVLDTSALLAYIENEEGAIEIGALLQKALDDEIVLYISIVSCIEVLYISWQEQGKEVAAERLKLIDDWMSLAPKALPGEIRRFRSTGMALSQSHRRLSKWWRPANLRYPMRPCWRL